MAKKSHELPRIELRRERASSQLGGAVGSYLPPGAKYEYRPPSVFVQYRVLTIIFAALALAALLYWALAPRFHPRPPADAADAPSAVVPQQQTPQADPVYVEPITPH